MTEALSRGSRRCQRSSWDSLMAKAIAALSSAFMSPWPEGCSGFMIPYVDAVMIEMLLAHEVEVGAGGAAAGRPGVAARAIGVILG